MDAALAWFSHLRAWDPAHVAVRAVYPVGDRNNSFGAVFAFSVPTFCGSAVAGASYGVELFYQAPGYERTYGAVDAEGDVVVAHFATGWQVWGSYHP